MCHLQVQVEPYTFLQKLYVINPDSRDSRKLAFYLISRVIDVNTQENKADPWSTVPAKSKGGGKGRGMGKNFRTAPYFIMNTYMGLYYSIIHRQEDVHA